MEMILRSVVSKLTLAATILEVRTSFPLVFSCNVSPLEATMIVN